MEFRFAADHFEGAKWSFRGVRMNTSGSESEHMKIKSGGKETGRISIIW